LSLIPIAVGIEVEAAAKSILLQRKGEVYGFVIVLQSKCPVPENSFGLKIHPFG
jgi:hypothetical protein